MNNIKNKQISIKTFDRIQEYIIRKLDPKAISLSPGYRIEVFAYGLDAPIGMAFSASGDIYIAQSGLSTGKANILRISNGQIDTIAEGFNAPITGISYLDGVLYISHKCYISIIKQDGTIENILSGLPCNGDFSISNIAFGPEGKIYFGLGTATNSGVVGEDNLWVYEHPLLHDVPPFSIILNGQNFKSKNILSNKDEYVLTGAFSAFGEPNFNNEIRKGTLKASGCILRANRDGTELEQVAFGLRNPVYVKFDRTFQLFASNRGYDNRGSRPVANASDEFQLIKAGAWYGWPDYSAGEPLTLPKFRPEGGLQPQILLAEHPYQPQLPFTTFSSHSTISGFDFNYNSSFSSYGDVFIAEFGSMGKLTTGPTMSYPSGAGHKVSKINMSNGEISTFAINHSGYPASNDNGGGFARLINIVFGPDEAMYIVDIGISHHDNPRIILPNTGLIWRLTRG